MTNNGELDFPGDHFRHDIQANDPMSTTPSWDGGGWKVQEANRPHLTVLCTLPFGTRTARSYRPLKFPLWDDIVIEIPGDTSSHSLLHNIRLVKFDSSESLRTILVFYSIHDEVNDMELSMSECHTLMIPKLIVYEPDEKDVSDSDGSESE